MKRWLQRAASRRRSLVTMALSCVLWLPAPTSARPPLPPPAPDFQPLPKPQQTPALRRALLINPLLPIVAALASAAGVPSVVAKLRLHATVTPRWGWTVAPQVGVTHLFIDLGVVGVETGPRISLSGRGLTGWYLFPKAVAGWVWSVNNDDKMLVSAPIFGAGAESGYLWRWGHVVLELGFGLYVASLRTDAADALREAAPTLRPQLNISVGWGT